MIATPGSSDKPLLVHRADAARESKKKKVKAG
jgi:hypothetical protein